MGDVLWMNFLDERVDDLQEVLLTVGVNGLLSEFEHWMLAEGYISAVGGDYKRWKKPAPPTKEPT